MSFAPIWKMRNPALPEIQTQQICEELEISPFLASLLSQRGLSSLEQMEHFLCPGLRYLAPLASWPAVQDAARVLMDSINKNHKIAVWGDYDVDGITATALVKSFFKQKGLNISTFIPKREAGYGLNCSDLQELHAAGVQTLVTVDCGIASTQEIKKARELDMTVIVTDHHTPDSNLPQAQAILNPHFSPCPCPNLAGVGVAFFLMGALNKILPGPKLDIRTFLDLVALGTIADVVPLDEQNRILVKNGILMLNSPQRAGIFALKKVCGFDPEGQLGVGDISFGLAPRINAAGRIGNPEHALELLLTKDLFRAQKLAGRLDRLNGKRKSEEEKILHLALTQAQEQKDKAGIILFSPDWNAGIIGIVASRIMEKFYRPCLIMTQDGEVLKGSGRSIREVDLYQALCACSQALSGFGGHKQAAGFRLAPEKLPELKNLFDLAVRQQLPDKLPAPRLLLDAELPFSEINCDLVQELEMMQPFGPGNARPLFKSPNINIKTMRVFGKGSSRHLELGLQAVGSKANFKGVAWRQAGRWEGKLSSNKNYQIAFRPKLNTYNGLIGINLQIEDIQEQ